jgi:hypothetical protein
MLVTQGNKAVEILWRLFMKTICERCITLNNKIKRLEEQKEKYILKQRDIETTVLEISNAKQEMLICERHSHYTDI